MLLALAQEHGGWQNNDGRLGAGKKIPVRWIGEQQVREDLGFIPSFADWVEAIRTEPWLVRALRLEDKIAAGTS